MNNLVIKVSKDNRCVLPSKTIIGNDTENLQYNMVFEFIDEFVDGVARLEYQIDEDKNYIWINKKDNTYYVPIKNILTKEGNVNFQLVITEEETTEGIPVYKSDIFTLYCKGSLNAVTEAPDSYELWIEQANQLIMTMQEQITEVETLNIEVDSTSTGANIIFTDKNGDVTIVPIYNGADGADGADGRGIVSITKTDTTGLVDTYTITYSDDTTSTFTVTNGNGIESITKTATVGNVDTYTITYTNGNTTTFTVTNSDVTRTDYDLLLNQIPTGNVENSSITLNDSSNLPIKNIEIEGDTDQFTTTGKNKLNNTLLISATTDANVTATPNSDGSITLNGTADANAFFNLSNTNFGDANLSSNDTTYTTYILSIGATISGVRMDYNATNNYTYIRVANGTALSNVKIYPMVRLSSVTDGTYEPYTNGASPNPDYPQDVEVVTGDNTIYTNTKNWINLQTCEAGFLSTSGIVSGVSSVTEYSVSDNSISFTTNQVNRGFVTDFIPIFYNEYKISYEKSNDNAIVGFIGYYDKDKNWIQRKNMSSNYETIPSNVKYIKVNLQLEFAGSITLSNIQLEHGKTATTYQRHDSASYPLNLGVKNLFNTSLVVKGHIDNAGAYSDSGASSITINGAEVTVTTTTSFRGFVSDYIEIKPNTNYKMSYNKLTSGATYFNYYNWYDENKTFINRSGTTSPSNCKYVRIFTGIYETMTFKVSNCQLEEGEEASSYSPYGTTPLELCKIGDYQDYIYKDNGTWYKHTEIGKVTLDGSENSWEYAGGNAPYRITMSGALITIANNQPPLIKCDKFIPVAENASWSSYESMVSTDNLSFANNTLRFRYTSISSLEDFKNWLSTHNTDIYYVLANPINTTITDTTLINQLNAIANMPTYKNITNIEITASELKPILNLTYRKDLETLFEEVSNG